VVEDGVRVEVEADVVLLQYLGNDRRLSPRCSAVRRSLGADEVVFVAVYLRCIRRNVSNLSTSSGVIEMPATYRTCNDSTRQRRVRWCGQNSTPCR
jgi:hypothetical protein